MSFDVFIQTFQDGDEGTPDAGAARDVLAEVPHKHEPEFDSYDVELADGSHLEMFAEGLDGREPFTGAMFALRDVTDAVADFIFRFSRAAKCVILPAMDPPCALLTDENQAPHLPADVRDEFQVISIASGGELLAALEGGYETWRAYRNRVVGEGR